MKLKSIKIAITSCILSLLLIGNSPADSKAIEKKSKVTYSHQSQNLWREIASDFSMPHHEQTPEVKAQIRWFQRNKQLFKQSAKYSDHYLYHISNEIKKRGLPSELALLPMIESGFDPFAHSKAGALGLWQFMPRTAKEVGIKRNSWYEGRRDIISSTNGALDYLTSLNKSFNGDWLATIAAYNSGAGTVRSAIHRKQKLGADDNFWELSLPKQTKTYVPRLLALAAIIENPSKYGIQLEPIKAEPYFSEVTVDKSIDLQTAASLAEVSVTEMHRLNPGFIRTSASPTNRHTLLIPKEKLSTFNAHLQDQPELQQLPEKPLTNEGYFLYAVRPGNTLSEIANKFHVTTDELQLWNNIRNKNNLQVGSKLTIWHPENSQGHTEIAEALYYQVRKGDSLAKIAKQYQVKVSELKKWNTLDEKRYIHPGQKLVIKAS